VGECEGEEEEVTEAADGDGSEMMVTVMVR